MCGVALTINYIDFKVFGCTGMSRLKEVYQKLSEGTDLSKNLRLYYTHIYYTWDFMGTTDDYNNKLCKMKSINVFK